MDGRAEHGDAPARNVLVVEDNEDLRSLIVRRLHRAGYEAFGVSLGCEAVEKAFERPGTALLIDHNLPDMSGQELVALLKERGAAPPFIIMTGQGDERLAVQMMKLGAFDYLVKNSELLDKLPETLGRLFGELETERRILEDRSILLDNIRTQVWYLTDDHTYGAVNKAHADFCGLRQEMMSFRDMFELFPREVAELHRSNAMKVFGTAEPLTVELWLPSSTGELRLLSIYKSPKLREDGSVEYVVCSAEDVTERKRAGDALRESEERFRKLFSSVQSVSVQGYAADGTVRYWNSASEQLYGYTADEAIGGNLLDLIIPRGMREAVRNDIRDMVEKGEGRAAERLALKKKDGSRVDVLSSHVVVDYIDGRRELFCLDIDIGEQIRMEEALRAAKENAEWLGQQAEAASKAKSAFLANTSHELRTPLNGAIGFLELLADTPLNELQKEYVGYIRTSAFTLLEVISEVLDISKIESDRFDLEYAQSDVFEVMRKAVDAVRGTVLRKELRLELRIEEGTPRYAVVDPLRLKQVLVNLLGNAVKFTEKGFVELALQCVALDAGRCAYTFSVRDTGIGIAPEVHRKLFEPFFQADASNTRKYGGVGLGITICEALLQKMESRLQLESAPGQGSRFFFTLCARCDAEPEETTNGERTNLLPAKGVPLPLRTNRQAVVLLAEDQRLNRRLLRILVSKLVPGARIIEASDGEEAVRFFRSEAPDIVFMDLQMPLKDGCEAVAEIRSLERASSGGTAKAGIPIIAVTADVQKETRTFCLENGMDDFITKPVDAWSLRCVLERCLESVLL